MDTNDATLDIIPREEDWRFKEASADDPHRSHEANFYAFFGFFLENFKDFLPDLPISNDEVFHKDEFSSLLEGEF